ncbi:uncharacterized protein LOC124363327 [Homalodisca vitripennis]|nr:uncharacterized protein LOC124363327 [Homalodisca vitripennis]
MADTSTVIEGSVKFRDGKKWKSRWCVMRRLSPVADCLHLQLYRDSKDRYKQGQTKASLSLQDFLGVYSGFTLDKESNTIAIICQDVTVVLAFDTRERLIQWQVKIANNLGEDEQFLVQVSTAPARGKVPPGPARLHVQEHRFCLTVGVPPRLVGHWQVRQLRKYGLVDNKFCFEGGSSCGKGEGLYVLVTDQGENITRAFQMAAEGRLAVRRRPLARNMSVMTSPRRSMHPRVSDLSCVQSVDLTTDSSCGCSRSHDDLLGWPSAELWSSRSQRCEYADAASTADYAEKTTSWRERDGRQLERCASCISKLGLLSRSSTLTTTPAWSMDNYDRRHMTSGSVSLASNYDRTTVSSMEYWTPQSSSPPSVASRQRSYGVPGRPVAVKPPVPHHCHSPYSNYDVPRPAHNRSCVSNSSELASNNCRNIGVAGENYDTPRNIRESLPIQPELLGRVELCHCCGKTKHQHHCTSVVVEKENPRMLACPCQRVMCWAGSWMRLPYLLTGAFRNNGLTNTTIHKVKLDGEGKMPFVNCRGENYRCETPSNNYPLRATLEDVQECERTDSRGNPVLKAKKTQYANIKVIMENTAEHSEPVTNQQQQQHESNPTLPYANLEFAKSLEYYENSRDLLQKAEICKNLDNNNKAIYNEVKEDAKNGGNCCTKCGHTWNNLPPKPSPKNDDYLIMEPAVNHPLQRRQSQPSSPLQSPVHEKVSQGYLPMLPISGKTEELQHLRMRQLNEKSQSTPSLPIPRRKSFNNPSVHGSLVYHSISETNSPYPRRRLMTSAASIEPDIRKELLVPSVRKRSSSMDSSRYLENLESIEEKVISPNRTIVNTPTISNATSIDSLSDLSLNQRPIPTSSSEHGLSRVDHSDYVPCKTSLTLLTEEATSKEATITISKSDNPVSNPTVHIKRSASIPCKSVYNRDSSSSNDSGVSTGSLQFRRRDLMELDFNSIRKRSVPDKLKIVRENVLSEIPILRKSKSVDPFDQMSFEFSEIKPPVKSSSAGASVPVCVTKIDSKGFLSPGTVPYIDSHSTSSGTSDMSDYIETLSLSSYTSSDTPDSFLLSHPAVNTLRPRSGKEYHTIDRTALRPQTNSTVISSSGSAEVNSSEA